jgi:hypothetical protein
MAGPFTWWPNRKSAIGLRQCSKRPYAHSRVFVTAPPVARSPMLDLNTLGVDEKTMLRAEIERLQSENRRLVAREADLREDAQRLLESSDAIARHSEGTTARCKEVVEAAKAEFIELRKQLAAAQKEADPDTIALKIMYAVDAATERHQREVAELRAVISTKDTEIAELKRSKRRLREALDRLSKET